MKVRYLNSLPEDFRLKEKKSGPIQLQLDEFMKVDSSIMEISIAGHYKSIDSARSTWYNAIKASGYHLRVIASKNKEAIYIIKETSMEVSN